MPLSMSLPNKQRSTIYNVIGIMIDKVWGILETPSRDGRQHSWLEVQRKFQEERMC